MLIKPIEWIGPTKSDLSRFPEPVKRIVGRALFEAQRGAIHRDAKPMKGRLRDVTVIVVDDDVSTFRIAYTTKLKDVVYALCAFQKKPTTGIATIRRHVALIEQRLKEARTHHAKNHNKNT